MDAWIIISISAAFFQAIRFALQKVLSVGTLTTAGSTFARFFYSAPFAIVLLGLYLARTGYALPELSARFWMFALTGAASQILATVCVVAVFRQRNFAVGTTFAKTAVIQTAILGLLILGDRISAIGFVAILIGLAGIVLLSKPPDTDGNWRKVLFNRAAALGLLSGFLFGISGVSYRGATLEIDSADALFRAGVTYVVVVLCQVGAMLVWLRVREPGQIARVWAARRLAVWAGITSMAGSLCWFWAFSLQAAAYVNAVGQIELLFTLLFSTLFFRETINRREVLGIGLLTLSILVLILAL